MSTYITGSPVHDSPLGYAGPTHSSPGPPDSTGSPVHDSPLGYARPTHSSPPASTGEPAHGSRPSDPRILGT